MNHLQAIKFKNRLYLFFLFIPFPFILFLLTALLFEVYIEWSTWTLLLVFFPVFTLELNLAIWPFAKMRYIPDGKFEFDSKSFAHNNVKIPWSKISNLEFYYRGDSLWKSKLRLYQIYKGHFRYNNLSYIMVKDHNEKMVDKIILNSKNTIYLKIRNEEEKERFFRIKEFAELNNVNVTKMKTDFTYTVMGRTFGK